MKLVSVIVPVYNVQLYLEKCLQSIVDQTYKQLEIIVVDDGSTDNSGKVADDFAKKNANIRVYHKINGGLSSARNYGLKHARGEFYVFIDSDDFVDSNFIKTMMEKRDGADLVISNYTKVDIKGNHLEQDKQIKKDGLWNRTEFWNRYYFEGLWITCEVSWNKLYSRKALENIEFPVSKLHEDEFVIGPIVDNCRSIKVVNDSLYYYVQRENSIMHTKYKGNLDLATALLERYEFFARDSKEKMIDIQEATLCAASNSLALGFFEKEDKAEYYSLKHRFDVFVQQQLNQKKSRRLFLQAQLCKYPRLYRSFYQLRH